MTATKKSVLALTFLIIGGYMAARWGVYRAMRPSPAMQAALAALEKAQEALVEAGGERASGEADLAQVWTKKHWFRRDLWMSVPRVLALLACLLLMRREGGTESWGWSWSISPAAAWFAGACAGQLLLFVAYPAPWSFTNSELAAGWAATVLVALFEEACFRGLLYQRLREAMTPGRAALLSSAVFMVYHVQAISFTGWPYLFLFGLAACAAREGGVGLGWLALGHLIVDGAWYSSPSLYAFFPGVACLLAGALLMLISAIVPWVRSSPPTAASPI